MREWIDLFEGTQSEILIESPILEISPQEAKNREMFGPVYHGTHHDINTILATGFNPKYSVPKGVGKFNNKPIGTSNGYSMDVYAAGIAAPIHHLGFGTYFTSVKAIAKKYNGDSVKNLKTFYIYTKNVLEINFGSPNTMMRWWLQNGYDMTPEATENQDFKAWVKATGNLTRNLRSKYDAVWFLGKGLRKLLDGDQICVYNPRLIYTINPALASGLEIGAKVTHNGTTPRLKNNELYIDDLKPTDFGNAGKLGNGWKGIFRAVDHEGNDIPRAGKNGIGNYPIHMIPPPEMVGVIVNKRFSPHHDDMYDVKWQKGGVQYNYAPSELKPFKK